jgi:cyclic-di-GMP-binding protein
VFESLVQSNRMAIKPADRLRFLEQIRGAADYVAQSLRPHYMGLTFPLPPASQDVAALAEALYSEMAVGYKTVVRDLTAGASKRDARALTLAIHRSMRCLGRLLLVNCHTYMPCSEGVWAELHQLYQCAEMRGLHDRSVEDESYQLMKAATVSDAYKQIGVLALTDPYHLPQEEVDKVYVALEQWAPLVHLRSRVEGDGPEAFIVRLGADEPPARTSAEETAGENYRIVDTSRLVSLLRSQLAQASAELADPIPRTDLEPGRVSSAATLAYLIQGWEARPGRRTDRTSRQLSVEVVNGLNAIHAYLTAHLDEYLQEESSVEAGQVEPWVDIGSPRTAPVIRVDLEAPDAAFGERVPVTHDCVVLDHGVGGCRLRWGSGNAGEVKVGALLLTKSKASPEPKTGLLGVVRWMRQDRDQPLETGVQWLTPNPSPAVVKPARTGAAAPRPVRALALPKRHLDRYARILVPSVLTYRAGDELSLEAREGVTRYELSTVTLQTAAFCELRLVAMPEPEAVQASAGMSEPQRAAHPVERFSALWEKL